MRHYTLEITFSCTPEDNGDRGIMYWLGTKKGTSDYVNPYSCGDVAISEWEKGNVEEMEDSERIKERKALMVQYRPCPEGDAKNSDVFGDCFGVMTGCDDSHPDYSGRSFNIHLRSGVAVSPTHYSIRHGGCYGMSGDWNFEASVDGKTWDVLHQSRLRYANLYGNCKLYSPAYSSSVEFSNVLNRRGSKSRKEAICEYMEKNHRQIIPVSTAGSKIYTHFRFLSIAFHKSDMEVGREACLHGIGFEIYGSVHEEWEVEQVEETDQDRIQRLENQNKALLNEVESLKARIRQLENKRSAEEACLS